jgi:hypothetical protein
MNTLVQYTAEDKKNPDAMNIALLKKALFDVRKHLMSSVDTADSFMKKEKTYTEAIYLINNIIHFIERTGGNFGFDDWETIEYAITLINSHLDEIGGPISNLKINLILSDESGEYPTIRELLESPKDILAPQSKRYDALEGIVFSERWFSSLQAQDRTLERIQKTIRWTSANQSDIWRFQSDMDSLEHMYRNFDPRWEDNTNLLNDIMVADTLHDGELAQRISTFIRVRSAEQRNYTATRESSPILNRHLRNLRDWHPISIDTLEYGKLNITHAKKMEYVWAQWEYYKLRTVDTRWKKQDILLRVDNAVIWDISRKKIWEFDATGNITISKKQQYSFTITWIESDKIQHKKEEPTLTQKVSKTLSSIKSSVLWIFGK